jgi:maltoporin
MGVELVEHFLYNVNSMLTVNAYGIFQFSKGADEDARLQTLVLNDDGTPQTNDDGTPKLRTDDPNWGRNFVVGVRTFLYLTDQFHLINELSFQGFKQQAIAGTTVPGIPMATKFTLMPTLVPSGERSAWARPHLRLIYTLAVYNHAAREAGAAGLKVSPYVADFGPRTFGHYLGARAEWWF